MLFKFNFSSCFFELLLDVLSFSLGNAFLNIAWCAVNQFLSFLQAQASDSPYDLDDVDLVGTSGFQNYVKRSLFFFSGSAGSRTSSDSNSCSSGFDAIIFLQYFCKFINFSNGEIYQLFCKSFQICHCCMI